MYQTGLQGIASRYSTPLKIRLFPRENFPARSAPLKSTLKSKNILTKSARFPTPHETPLCSLKRRRAGRPGRIFALHSASVVAFRLEKQRKAWLSFVFRSLIRTLACGLRYFRSEKQRKALLSFVFRSLIRTLACGLRYFRSEKQRKAALFFVFRSLIRIFAAHIKNSS